MQDLLVDVIVEAANEDGGFLAGLVGHLDQTAACIVGSLRRAESECTAEREIKAVSHVSRRWRRSTSIQGPRSCSLAKVVNPNPQEIYLPDGHNNPL